MDILAHGLWSGIAYKVSRRKAKKLLNLNKFIFWGVFPDLFSFIALFGWFSWQLVFNGTSPSDLPMPHEVEPFPSDTIFIFKLTYTLYNLSHSLFIFAVVFVLATIIFKKPIWELNAWFIHILIDIPSHSYQFFPTPFLWPFSSYRFNGFYWGMPYFLIFNYLVIFIIYLIFYRFKKRNDQKIIQEIKRK